MLNKNDDLFIDVDDERYQERNREIALERMEAKIVEALKSKAPAQKNKNPRTQAKNVLSKPRKSAPTSKRIAEKSIKRSYR